MALFRFSSPVVMGAPHTVVIRGQPFVPRSLRGFTFLGGRGSGFPTAQGEWWLGVSSEGSMQGGQVRWQWCSGVLRRYLSGRVEQLGPTRRVGLLAGGVPSGLWAVGSGPVRLGVRLCVAHSA